MRKKLKITGLIAMAGFLGLLGVYPWILAGVVRGQLEPHAGEAVKVRVEGHRFLVLEGVVLETPAGLSIDELRVRLPLMMIVDRLFSREEPLSIEAKGIHYDSPSSESSGEFNLSPDFALLDIYDQAWKWIQRLGPWIPRGEITGVSTGSADQPTVYLKQVRWTPEGVSAAGWILEQEKRVRLTLGAVNPDQSVLHLESIPWGIAIEGQLSRAGESLEIALDGRILAGEFSLQGRFPATGILPGEFSYRWVHPDITLLDQISGDFPSVLLTSEFAYEEESWSLRIDTDSASPSPRYPEWQVQAEARGDRHRANLVSLLLEVPFGRAALVEPVEMTFQPLDFSQPLQLEAEADLEHPSLASLGLSGAARGRFQVGLDPEAHPDQPLYFSGEAQWESPLVVDPVRLAFEGRETPEGISLPEISVRAGESVLSGQLDWQLTGAFPFQTRFDYHLKRDSFPLPSPEAIPVAVLSGNGAMEGTPGSVTYKLEGSSEGVQLSRLVPLAVNFELQGSPESLTVNSLTLTGAEVSAQLAGNVEREPGAALISLDNVVVDSGSEGKIALEAPFSGRLEWGKSEGGELKGSWSNLKLGGTQNEAAMEILLHPAETASAGKELPIHLEVSHVDSRFFDPWWEGTLPGFLLDRFEIQGQVPLNGDPIEAATLSLSGVYRWKPDRDVRLQGTAEVDAGRIRIQKLEGEGSRGSSLNLTGMVPLEFRVVPGQGFRAELDWDGPMEIEGGLVTVEQQLEVESEVGKVGVMNPLLTFSVDGSPAFPEGRIEMGFGQLAYVTGDPRKDLLVRDGLLRGQLNPERVQVESFTFSLGKSELEAEGSIPLEATGLAALLRDKEWRQLLKGSARLTLNSIQLKEFSGYLPTFIRDTGEIDGQIAYTPEGGLQGKLTTQGLSLKRLANNLAFTDIGGALVFDANRFSFDDLKGRVGGRPVSSQGWLEWSPGTIPLYSLAVQSESFPLSRSSGLVLRGDLDLVLAREVPEKPTLISGSVLLKNSLFLQNLAELVEPGTASAQSRPPYFSIDQDPFSAWMLDIQITGQKFLRIDTTLFRGVVSSEIELLGTMKTPYLQGVVLLNSGEAIFPFGRFQMETGQAEFTISDPYEPRLDARGKSRTMGYDIDMTVGGTLSSPNLEFESDPSMTNEEVLLLLTGGVLPGNDTTSTLSQNSGKLAFYLGQGFVSDLFGSSSSDRLRIASGEDISESGRETFHVEYDLTDDFSVIGEYDKYDRYNLDVRWRIRSK